ncbi:glycosyltransferase family 2 protein [Flavobacterium sp. TMP13]|uniref:glycosyltransferase family 2 protein n=1 Tax=Flavobacterium sp. TMP13 TaxID=3425950 RepID=UPI003D78A602
MMNSFFPTVSLIIPCYNNEKYIKKTLTSVKEQTYSSWECIIINDGSTDNSEETILNYIEGDPRFTYKYQENQGVCTARNSAIKNFSKGKYILCLDGDDLISKNFIDETVEILESNTNVIIATSKIQFFGRSRGNFKVASYDMATLLAENQLVITSLFRKDDFDKVGGFNNNMSEGLEDWDFWISILKNNPSGQIKNAPNACFYYRLLNVSRNNQITEDKEKRLRYQLWENHKELFSLYFVDPTKSFEFRKYSNSIEYKLGKIILAPVRKLKFHFVSFNEFLFN